MGELDTPALDVQLAGLDVFVPHRRADCAFGSMGAEQSLTAGRFWEYILGDITATLGRAGPRLAEPDGSMPDNSRLLRA